MARLTLFAMVRNDECLTSAGLKYSCNKNYNSNDIKNDNNINKTHNSNNINNDYKMKKSENIRLLLLPAVAWLPPGMQFHVSGTQKPHIDFWKFHRLYVSILNDVQRQTRLQKNQDRDDHWAYSLASIIVSIKISQGLRKIFTSHVFDNGWYRD
jgi:hypothetical protein